MFFTKAKNTARQFVKPDIAVFFGHMQLEQDTVQLIDQ